MAWQEVGGVEPELWHCVVADEHSATNRLVRHTTDGVHVRRCVKQPCIILWRQRVSALLHAMVCLSDSLYIGCHVT